LKLIFSRQKDIKLKDSLSYTERPSLNKGKQKEQSPKLSYSKATAYKGKKKSFTYFRFKTTNTLEKDISYK
jgi:hypothetical protein